ncbi:hypothetical protein QN277_026250 [Acacia crassicarpa]|uniref:Uncharacterized protein n=1 Tax=Acacia crassicarpa TaxID=499986 RepID=A0AAE1MH81_9FABA|nr:hypothetical protein QN277_026250 [Acacia crassicarpa]
MALVLSKKAVAHVPSSSEEDDLLNRSSKKIKNNADMSIDEEWPALGDSRKTKWTSSGISFADKLQGINSSANKEERVGCSTDASDDPLSEDSEKEECEPLCKIVEDPNRNFPSFSFSEKMKKRLYKAWNRALIVKLLGRSIGYKALLSILQSLWAKRGVISLIILEMDTSLSS